MDAFCGCFRLFIQDCKQKRAPWLSQKSREEAKSAINLLLVGGISKLVRKQKRNIGVINNDVVSVL